MRIALTGTPGTGKTSVSKVLRDRGYDVLDMTQYIKEHDLREEYDPDRDTYDVDVERLNDALAHYDDVIFEGHLAHFMDVDSVIVLRCHPDVMKTRLEARGYDESKVLENIQAEVLDVILFEAVESDIPTFCVDTSHCDVNKTADEIEDVMKGNTLGHMPEDISWAEEMDKWF